MDSYDLDTVLMGLGEGVEWTARHAVEGTQIFGGIGSGKTSGSGAFIAKKFLQNGYGGLVLSVKPGELEENWLPYCQETNRLDDLIVVKPCNRNHFNFISYELNHSSGDKGAIDNLAHTLKTVLNASRQNRGGQNDDFWEDALDMLLFNVLDLCYWAYGKRINIDKISDVVNSLPGSEKDYRQNKERLDANKKAKTKKQSRKAFFNAFDAVENLVAIEISNARDAFERAYPDKELGNKYIHLTAYKKYAKLKNYFRDSFVPLADKTKSIVEHMLKGLLFRLSREPVYSLLCGHQQNFQPEHCIGGKIIFIDLPVKDYDKVGKDAQILFKYIWQRAMERRDVQKDGGRPVFLWADEAQNFLHEHDIDYQATARSSRVCTVYLTQNLPNYYAHLGGREGEYHVKSFIGTMGTKIFHANADVETNDYASALCGKIYYTKKNTSFQTSGDFSSSESQSLELIEALRPEKFVSLATGGKQNNYTVQAYLHRQGTPMIWHDKARKHYKRNFKFIQLTQKIRS
ncbi:MAG: TraM recognition domain-containing protein [Cyclobacteriaceae bacterium]